MIENNQQVIVIAAIGKNRELGKNNDLIWKISEDLKRFKSLTSGHTVIMGRGTYDSLPNPLPNRTNIVITRSPDNRQGVKEVGSLEEALYLAKLEEPLDIGKIFIIGGESIYNEIISDYMSEITSLEITEIDQEDPEADKYFPEIPKEFFYKERSNYFQTSPFPCKFVTYKRKGV